MSVARRVLDTSFVRRNDGVRSFAVAAWLGWQIESNWADPFLFAIYSIVRPVASALILVVMYSVITDAAFGEPIFPYIYLGNALYILVGQIITGVSWAIIDDREHYHVSKHLYTAPISGYAYLFGRGIARIIIGSISVVITIAFGVVAFKLPVSLTQIDWTLLLSGLALGTVALAALGLLIGAWTMTMARHFWSVGEALARGHVPLLGRDLPAGRAAGVAALDRVSVPGDLLAGAVAARAAGPGRAGLPDLRGVEQRRAARRAGRLYRRADARLDPVLWLGAEPREGRGDARHGVELLARGHALAGRVVLQM